MAEEDVKKLDYVERVLITLNPDGTIKGAAQYSLTRVLDGNGKNVVPDVQGEAQPLTGAALAGVLENAGDLSAAGGIAAQNEALSRANERLAAELKEALARSAKLAAALHAVKEKITDAIG